MKCSHCSEKNAQRNVFCGSCGQRLRPVDPRVKQDVLAVLREERKRRWAWVGIAITVLGILGIKTVADAKVWILANVRPVMQDATTQTRNALQAEAKLIMTQELGKFREEMQATLRNQRFPQQLKAMYDDEAAKIADVASQSKNALRNHVTDSIAPLNSASIMARPVLYAMDSSPVSALSTTSTARLDLGANGKSVDELMREWARITPASVSPISDTSQTLKLPDSLILKGTSIELTGVSSRLTSSCINARDIQITTGLCLSVSSGSGLASVQQGSSH